MNQKGHFVGFGFGAIQAGLMVYEAFESGAFETLTVAEVVPEVVDALRRHGGRYHLNVALPDRIEKREIRGLEILNPRDPVDRAKLVERIAAATEIATALPSVTVFGAGGKDSVAGILAEGLSRKIRDRRLPRAVIYAAENHNHAAELLDQAIAQHRGPADAADLPYQCLNTVIGKMSGIVVDPVQIREQDLAPMTPGAPRCFLVEAFNRILVTQVRWPDFQRGIRVFEEKPDLLPFEEAKLYGHNATHALLGYLAHRRGYVYMAQVATDPELMKIGAEAFVEESGQALCRRHQGLDPLFTERGYRAYAEDLLVRMVNPHLRDAVERVIRDPKRKLGWEDRLVGTMRLALKQGVEPRRYALGAAAAVQCLEAAGETVALEEIWGAAAALAEEKRVIKEHIAAAASDLHNTR